MPRSCWSEKRSCFHVTSSQTYVRGIRDVASDVDCFLARPHDVRDAVAQAARIDRALLLGIALCGQADLFEPLSERLVEQPRPLLGVVLVDGDAHAIPPLKDVWPGWDSQPWPAARTERIANGATSRTARVAVPLPRTARAVEPLWRIGHSKGKGPPRRALESCVTGLPPTGRRDSILHLF